MVNTTEELYLKELRPVLIPPRKRQITKQLLATHKYVDYIVKIEVIFFTKIFMKRNCVNNSSLSS